MPDFDTARRETIRYHDELYASTSLDDAEGWLSKPHRLVFDALELVPRGRPVIAYDLGAGIGRHVVPMLEHLPEGSDIYAIDLLASAVEQLRTLQPDSGTTTLHVRQQDLADVRFVDHVDLVFAFSAVEHLPDLDSLRALLQRIRAALAPGGVVALGIVADRYEIDERGLARPALLESGVTTAEVNELLVEAFGDLQVHRRTDSPAQIPEERDGETYTLASTLITWIGRR